MSDQKLDYRVLMAKALSEIKDLKSKLNASKNQSAEPIAIIGASCRFPGGANDLDSYWDLLVQGKNAIVEVPAERWSADDYYDADQDAPGKICSKLGGFLNLPVADFDASFFAISPREAESVDPQQRLLLELCWEAIEHANIIPENLFKSNTGVFMGVSSLDNATRIIGEAPLTDIDGYYGTGIALSPTAGRISYLFGFSGPSFVVDTACSSSLLSLHLACESLRRKECDMALAGGVQLLTHPGLSIAFTKAHMLSVDGQCKTFDANANGYVRGEGGGVILLKRLSDAQKDADEILAVIRGSAVNQDGSSGGLTVPSGPSQEAVIRRAIAQGNIDPAQINYIEAHGTGTPLGDPIEMGALTAVFGDYRTKSSPIRVGSVKTNMGHLEAGAGIASAIKVMLSLRNKTIAPHLNFSDPNPLIPWSTIPVEIPKKSVHWSPIDENIGRIAGVSSFGFSGTNVHLVMSEWNSDASISKTENTALTDVQSNETTSENLLVLSAKTEQSLKLLAHNYATQLRVKEPSSWPAFAHTSAVSRTHFRHRIAVSAASGVEAADLLEEFITSANTTTIATGSYHDGDVQKTLLLFTGQGSQYKGMGQKLYQTQPIFASVIDQCNVVMQPILGQSLIDILFDEKSDLNNTGNTQPALYALEVALATYWKHLGGSIHGVVGHSVGEYAAAAVVGIFNIEDGARLIAHRAQLMQKLPLNGSMLAVLTSRDIVENKLDEWNPKGVSVAAFNGPTNVVLSGEKDAIDAIKSKFEVDKIECRELSVSHAFHSHLMDPILEPYRKIAADVRFSDPSIPIYSNLSGEKAQNEIKNADYWVNHIRKPVQFEASIQSALKDGYNQFIEIGPKPTLISLAKTTAAIVNPTLSKMDSAWVPLMRKSTDEYLQILYALGADWCSGGLPKWHLIGSGLSKIPTYAFDRKPYWKEVTINAGKSGKLHGIESSSYEHPLIGSRFQSPLMKERFYETTFSKEKLPFLEDHRVFGELVVAGASHLSMVFGAAEIEFEKFPICLKQVIFPQALVVPNTGERTVQLMLTLDKNNTSFAFRLISFDKTTNEPGVHAIGTITRDLSSHPTLKWDDILKRCSKKIDPETIYRSQAERNIVVGESYKWLKSVNLGQNEAVAELTAPKNTLTSGFSIHPGFIDSCFGVLVMSAQLKQGETFIPFSLESIQFYRPIGNDQLRIHATLRPGDHDGTRIIGDISIETDLGEKVASFIGLEGRNAKMDALLSRSDRATKMIYRSDWKPVESNNSLYVDTGKSWVFMADQHGFASKIAKDWQKIGHDVVLVEAGSKFIKHNNSHFVVNPKSKEDWIRFLNDVSKKPIGLLSFTSLDETEFDLDNPVEQQNRQLSPLLNFIQIITQRGISIPVIAVTLSGTFIDSKSPILNPQSGAIRGFLRSVGVEHSELKTGTIDLKSGESVNGNLIDSAVNCIMSGETSVAIRNEKLLTERLNRDFNKSDNPVGFSADTTCIISGGLGSLGLSTTKWLMQQGARNFILIGRRSPDKMQKSAINDLAKAGANIRTLKCDITDYNSLLEQLQKLGKTFTSTTSVFHLAGELSDGPVNTMSTENLLAPFKSKVQGAINLHRVTESLKLDHFVLFSSIVSVTGSAAQANYSAANSLLGAFARYRNLNGLRALAINWGPWADSGMAANLDQRSKDRIKDQGINMLSDEIAFEALGHSLGDNQSIELSIADFDTAKLNFNSISLFNDLIDSKQSTSEAKPTLLINLKNTAASRREILLTRKLGEILTHALRMRPRQEIDPRERLFDLGVDSLIAVELKNRLQSELGTPISSTLLFDYPTIESLVNYILEDLLVQQLNNNSVDKVASSKSQEHAINETITSNGTHGKNGADVDKGIDTLSADAKSHNEINSSTQEEEDEAELLKALDELKGMKLS